MATKLDLKEWVVEALRAHGGSAHPIDVAKFIWVNYQDELQGAGELVRLRRSPTRRSVAAEGKERQRPLEACLIGHLLLEEVAIAITDYRSASTKRRLSRLRLSQ